MGNIMRSNCGNFIGDIVAEIEMCADDLSEDLLRPIELSQRVENGPNGVANICYEPNLFLVHDVAKPFGKR